MLKRIGIIVGLSIYILIVILLHSVLFCCYPSGRLRIVSRWSRQLGKFLCWALGIRVVIEGDVSAVRRNGAVIVANHISYLDGILLGSMFPLLYISKRQVASWPFFGLIAVLGSTIFIDREKKTKVPAYVMKVCDALRQKINVLVFAEGTSTNGEQLRPFQAIHFQAPLLSGAVVVPVVVTYSRIDGQPLTVHNRDAVCWYGQVPFFSHLLGVLRLRRIEARVMIYPPWKPKPQTETYTRKDLSVELHSLIKKSYPLVASA